MLETFIGNFHFLRPYCLSLLIPFALLGYLQWRRRDAAPAWQALIAAHLLPAMLVRGSQRRLFSPLWVSVLLSLLLVIALAGPSWMRGTSPFAEDAAALVIAIDLSESMGARDLAPDRLQRARSKVLQLARARGEANTALVAYAGTAHTVIPLSNDSTLLLHYLDALRIGMLPRRGKAPESAIPVAAQLLSDRPWGGTLLIVGDGAASAAGRYFAPLKNRPGLQVLVWGMGKNQAMLAADARRGLDSGAPPLQETQLRAIARAAGGHYVRSTPDDRDVRELLRRIDRHFQGREDSARPWIDGGYYLLALILPLFALWFRSGWVLRW